MTLQNRKPNYVVPWNARAKRRAQQMMNSNRESLVRILRNEREDFTSGESFRVCRFPDNRLCETQGLCPHCLEIGFGDPRTNAEIANIIIAGN